MSRPQDWDLMKMREFHLEQSPSEIRIWLKAWSEQLRTGEELTIELRAYLIQAFEKIGNGEDAAIALQLHRGRGKKRKDDEASAIWEEIFREVRKQIRPLDDWPPGLGKDLKDALKWAKDEATKKFGVPKDAMRYDMEYVEKRWREYKRAYVPLVIPQDDKDATKESE